MVISRNSSIIIASFLAIGLVLSSMIFLQLNYPSTSKIDPNSYQPAGIDGSAANFKISNETLTSFGTYIPEVLSYSPSLENVQIRPGLSNVDMQGLSVTDEMKSQLENQGFVIVDEGYEDIYPIYERLNNKPKFITTDLCLHAYHILYDISLRILEGTKFTYDFQTMIQSLREEQIQLKTEVVDVTIKEAITKNIAYLSVMLYLLDNTTIIPSEASDLVNAELINIESYAPALSAIFGYEEDFSQYKVRGHYTRNDILSRYFSAMMYAGRMGFLLQSPNGEVEMGINQTRMALLLISSFNATIGDENVFDYWDRVYQPTTFYVGASDDLTVLEYYELWQECGAPEGDLLKNDTVILDFIEMAKTYRKPKINSMFIEEVNDHGNVTQGFRLMGQRFIPDSYIFQELVHTKVNNRLMPNGLDVFSVFGSPRAAYHLQSENETYFDYSDQILKLRSEFADLNEYDWTQNLYWLWLYSLFPLLSTPTEGFPGFMQNEAWLDKALMTAMGSWAELRHDTILYAKQSTTYRCSLPETLKGYVEPYPEVYSRLTSLVHLMRDGLDSRGLYIEGFSDKLILLEENFARLVNISIRELENKPLTEEEYDFINIFGEELENIASYSDPEDDPWVSEADNRMAIIADVHTDPNSGNVLEVGTGNPYVIYVIVQDSNNKLRLTRGGTFSYYEFKYPLVSRLTDEEWQNMIDTDPPDIPDWISFSILDNTIPPIINKEIQMIEEKRK